jgi:deazaflavin-dependent oxidoreductase (nitroreductase family)
MTKTYRLGPGRRIVNRFIRALVAAGLSPQHYALLTVTGRRTGRRLSTPVRPIEHDGQRFLVAPYGAVGWVRNARAAGQVTLTRGRHTETVTIVEQPPASSGAVLRAYARAVPVTRPYFDARSDDPPDRFTAEADKHPVFRIVGPAIADPSGSAHDTDHCQQGQ